MCIKKRIDISIATMSKVNEDRAIHAHHLAKMHKSSAIRVFCICCCVVDLIVFFFHILFDLVLKETA